MKRHWLKDCHDPQLRLWFPVGMPESEQATVLETAQVILCQPSIARPGGHLQVVEIVDHQDIQPERKASLEACAPVEV